MAGPAAFAAAADAPGSGRLSRNRRDDPGRFADDRSGPAPDRFPFIAANAAQMVAGDSDERFRFAIDVVIDGLLARAARR
jgi:hypothetical protein